MAHHDGARACGAGAAAAAAALAPPSPPALVPTALPPLPVHAPPPQPPLLPPAPAAASTTTTTTTSTTTTTATTTTSTTTTTTASSPMVPPVRLLWNQTLAPRHGTVRVPNGCLFSTLMGVRPDAPEGPVLPSWVTAYFGVHLKAAPLCLLTSLLCLGGVTPPWSAWILVAVVPGLLMRIALCNYAVMARVAHTFDFYFLMGTNLLGFAAWGDMLQWDVRAVIPATICLVFYPNALMTDAVTAPQLGRNPAIYVISTLYFSAVFIMVYAGGVANMRARSVSLFDDRIRFFIPEFFLSRLGTQMVFLFRVVAKILWAPHDTIGIFETLRLLDAPPHRAADAAHPPVAVLVVPAPAEQVSVPVMG